MVGWSEAGEWEMCSGSFFFDALFNPPRRYSDARRILQLLQITLLIGFHRLKREVKYPISRQTQNTFRWVLICLRMGSQPLVIRMHFIDVTTLTIYRKWVLIFNGMKETLRRTATLLHIKLRHNLRLYSMIQKILQGRDPPTKFKRSLT